MKEGRSTATPLLPRALKPHENLAFICPAGKWENAVCCPTGKDYIKLLEFYIVFRDLRAGKPYKKGIGSIRVFQMLNHKTIVIHRS